MKLASILINNYNYGEFLADSVESALAQTYSNVEVIVVDDGSTDDSARVLNAYAGKIQVIRKGNGGQASAYNAGYFASSGQVLIFLDADDVLQPTALARAMPSFESPDVIKVHWSLALADEHGRATGQLYPQGRPAEGDLRKHVCAMGPSTIILSANGAYARPFVDRIFPVPEDVYSIGADGYLFELAPFFGKLVVVDEPQLLYRQHGRNDHVVIDLDVKVQRGISSLERIAPIALAECRRIGCEADLDTWRRYSWWHRVGRAVAEIKRTIPPSSTFVLVDDQMWGGGDALDGRRIIPFLERHGMYWGAPSNDAEAIESFERLRSGGVDYIVFAWSAFWWLETYSTFTAYLRRTCHHAVGTEDVVIFTARG
jgi:glycosyltransferase involved in cell wall biosynthesis